MRRGFAASGGVVFAAIVPGVLTQLAASLAARPKWVESPSTGSPAPNSNEEPKVLLQHANCVRSQGMPPLVARDSLGNYSTVQRCARVCGAKLSRLVSPMNDRFRRGDGNGTHIEQYPIATPVWTSRLSGAKV